MNPPLVSVIMPVFNSEPFLAEAIQSVLDQSFGDFELIIINDGSADNSEFTILSFPDPRIVYIKNKENLGLIYSLNRGIDLSRGKYLARMDGDDICNPDRLIKQVDYLNQHKSIAVVASTVSLINESGNETGIWPLDRKTVSPKSIRRTLPFANCLAHPAVMMRSELIKKLKYKKGQTNIEDYDLWLRIQNRGYRIAKIDEPLLRYREHSNSVTQALLQKKNPFYKMAKMKIRVLFSEFFSGHISLFFIPVKLAIFLDLLKGTGKFIKTLFR